MATKKFNPTADYSKVSPVYENAANNGKESLALLGQATSKVSATYEDAAKRDGGKGVDKAFWASASAKVTGN
jgi:hypothetical protein